MKVRSNTGVNQLAGAIACEIRESGKVELQAIGPAAVNQAVKAVIVARSYLIPQGISIVIEPSFGVMEQEDRETTVIRMTIREENNERF